MDKRSGFKRLLYWLRRRPAPIEVDPADVGTAFGMELRLVAENEARGTQERIRPQAKTRGRRTDSTGRPS